jgi:6-phosphofructokinase 2
LHQILDTSGRALAAAVEEGVDLIKPNLREMRELSGTDPADAREWEEAAKTIIRTMRISVIALTMGHLGAASPGWEYQPGQWSPRGS